MSDEWNDTTIDINGELVTITYKQVEDGSFVVSQPHSRYVTSVGASLDDAIAKFRKAFTAAKKMIKKDFNQFSKPRPKRYKFTISCTTTVQGEARATANSLKEAMELVKDAFEDGPDERSSVAIDWDDLSDGGDLEFGKYWINDKD